MIDAALRSAVELFVTRPIVLVACDYDGTLAELVDDPTCAHPNGVAITALRDLALHADTHVAIISGRALRDLSGLIAASGMTDRVHLVGSHGGEFEAGVVDGIEPGDIALLDRLDSAMTAVAARAPGARIERKPSSITFHTREVDPLLVPDLVAAVLTGPGSVTGVRVKHGKDVVELTVVDAHKGIALRRVRETTQADAVLFVGDDVTDEDAFTALGLNDVGVKVGHGPTAATQRVGDVSDVAELLTLVATRRALAR